MCQRLNTPESNNFYFGTCIFICIGPLNVLGILKPVSAYSEYTECRCYPNR